MKIDVVDVGGIPEIVEENVAGFICSLDDGALWIEKITMLLGDAELREQFRVTSTFPIVSVGRQKGDQTTKEY